MRKSITRALLAFCLLSAFGFAELRVFAIDAAQRDSALHLFAHQQAAIGAQESDRPLHWLDDRFAPQPPLHSNSQSYLWLLNSGDGHFEPRWKRHVATDLASLGLYPQDLLPDHAQTCARTLPDRDLRQSRSLAASRYWYRTGIDAWQQAG